MPKTKDESLLRRLRERSGRRAETAAALWLQLKGYRIRDRRARTPACEIDLVAARNNKLVFVEVKFRKTRDAALEAVTPDSSCAWNRPPTSGSAAAATSGTLPGVSILSCSPLAACRAIGGMSGGPEVKSQGRRGVQLPFTGFNQGYRTPEIRRIVRLAPSLNVGT